MQVLHFEISPEVKAVRSLVNARRFLKACDDGQMPLSVAVWSIIDGLSGDALTQALLIVNLEVARTWDSF
jgi:hypothetical protein